MYQKKKIFINHKIEYRIKTALFSHNVIFYSKLNLTINLA